MKRLHSVLLLAVLSATACTSGKAAPASTVVVQVPAAASAGVPAASSSSTQSPAADAVPDAAAGAAPPAAPPAAPSTAPPVAPQPATNGLPCHDLKVKGYSFAQAVRYYHEHGDPDAMDVDHNGVPCETVYDAGSVGAFYGRSYGANYYRGGGYVGSLTCAQLRSRGFSYIQAVSYWYSEGEPSRMDADGNGQPCETVYPAADVRYYYG